MHVQLEASVERELTGLYIISHRGLSQAKVFAKQAYSNGSHGDPPGFENREGARP